MNEQQKASAGTEALEQYYFVFRYSYFPFTNR